MNAPMFTTYRKFIAFAIILMPLVMFAQVNATDDYAHTTVNASAIAIKVLSNDITSNGILKIDKLPLINNGKASVNSDSTEILFTPAKDFKGVALVNYTITDKRGNNDVGLVTIQVSESPSPSSTTLNLFTRPGEKIVFTLPKLMTNVSASGNQGNNDWIGGEGSGVYTFTPRSNVQSPSLAQFSFWGDENGLTKFYEVNINIVGTPISVLLKDDYVYIPINGL